MELCAAGRHWSRRGSSRRSRPSSVADHDQLSVAGQFEEMAHGPVPDEGLPHRDIGESCTQPGDAGGAPRRSALRNDSTVPCSTGAGSNDAGWQPVPAATDSVPREVAFAPPATGTGAGSWNSSRSHTETRRPPERGDHGRQTHTRRRRIPRTIHDRTTIQAMCGTSHPGRRRTRHARGCGYRGVRRPAGWLVRRSDKRGGCRGSCGRHGGVSRGDAETASASPEVPGDPPGGDYRP